METASVPRLKAVMVAHHPVKILQRTELAEAPAPSSSLAMHCLDPFWLASVPAEHFRDVLNVT